MKSHFRWILTVSCFALATLGWTLAQSDNELIVARGFDITTFDPHNHDGTAGEALAINIWDYLLFRDAEGEVQPSLATSWEVLDDTTWRFELREGVFFHDGSEMTAVDVKFSLERIANDNTLIWNDTYNVIQDIEIIGDHEILIHTDAPDPVMLSRLSRIGSAIVPKHYVEQVGWDGFAVAPIGTGPYKFVSWARDEQVVLDAFSDHWRGTPIWDTVIFRTVPEALTRVNELLTGGVDLIVDVPAHESNRISQQGGLQVIPWPTNRIMSLIVNTDSSKVTGDPRIREAIDYAIDDQTLIDVLFDGAGTPTLGRSNPGITHAPLDMYGSYNYDPEHARALIEEAGYGPDELTITIQGPAGRYAQDAQLAELISIMLQQIDVNTELEVLEWSAFNSRIFAVNNVENIAVIGLGNSMFDGWYANRVYVCPTGSYIGRTNWCNDEYDALVNAAELEMNPERRSELLAEAYYLLAEERAQIALFQVHNLAAANADLNWIPRPDELLWVEGVTPID